MNKVETFNKFNNGMRRPNRREHMRLCGFELNRVLERHNGKPLLDTKKYLDKLTLETNNYYHAVTLPYKTSDKWTYYEVWQKAIPPK